MTKKTVGLEGYSPAGVTLATDGEEVKVDTVFAIFGTSPIYISLSIGGKTKLLRVTRGTADEIARMLPKHLAKTHRSRRSGTGKLRGETEEQYLMRTAVR